MVHYSLKGSAYMEITKKLKNYIKENYNSVREFTIKFDIPYTTMDSIFRRGIKNSSVSNISKICSALNISLEALINNEIVPVYNDSKIPNTDGAIRIAEAFLKDAFVLSNGDKLCENDVKEIINILKEGLRRAK